MPLAEKLRGARVALIYGPGRLDVEGAAALVRGPERALLELGATVDTFTTAHYRECIQDFYSKRPTVGVERFAEDSALVLGLNRFLREGARYDWVLGYFYDSYLTDSVMESLRRYCTRIVNFPLNLLDQADHFERCMGFFDETWCSEEAALPDLQARHGNRIRYVAMASDPHIFRALGQPSEPALLFVGSAYASRLEELARCAEVIPTTVAGAGFGLGGVVRHIGRAYVRERRGLLPTTVARLLWDSVRAERRPVSDEMVVRLAAAHGVSIGFNDVRQEKTKRLVHKVRLREYDSTMMGLCHIAQRLPELERHFVAGKEILLYDHPREIPAILARIVGGEIPWREIGVAARRRAATDHTWTQRFSRALGE